nr:MAG TPA: hypothetical protein [Caudoviricetes sp.]
MIGPIIFLRLKSRYIHIKWILTSFTTQKMTPSYH